MSSFNLLKLGCLKFFSCDDTFFNGELEDCKTDLTGLLLLILPKTMVSSSISCLISCFSSFLMVFSLKFSLIFSLTFLLVFLVVFLVVF